MLFII